MLAGEVNVFSIYHKRRRFEVKRRSISLCVPVSQRFYKVFSSIEVFYLPTHQSKNTQGEISFRCIREILESSFQSFAPILPAGSLLLLAREIIFSFSRTP